MKNSCLVQSSLGYKLAAVSADNTNAWLLLKNDWFGFRLLHVFVTETVSLVVFVVY